MYRLSDVKAHRILVDVVYQKYFVLEIKSCVFKKNYLTKER